MKKKILAALLSAAMIISSQSGVLAAGAKKADDAGSVKTYTLTKTENPEVSKAIRKMQSELSGKTDKDKEFKVYDKDDVVRVSIILNQKSTISKYSTKDIAQNSRAMKYRDSLRAEQTAVIKKVEKALGGRKLDVVWNLTLAANIVSANVAYGDIKSIEAVDGVESVIMERRYEPAVTETTKAGPEMATSGEMIGSQTAWADGYTGAGSRIAIIDTGIDDDHQSFDSGAFNYALEENAEAAGLTAEEYKAGLDLLDEAEIKSAIRKLNVYSIDQSITAADLFRDDKIAFGYNYVTQDLDITHEHDGASEHGSHVAGIAAANKYIPSGDSYANALETCKVQGVAPDAQLLVMKVFGNAADGSTYSDGAYDSDYMAAIEDALILGADSINLSLGSSAPGFEKEYKYDYADILDSLTKSDTVVSISQGNNASIGDNSYLGAAYSDDNSFNTGGSPGSYTNSLAVASVDNTGFTGNYVMVGAKNMVFYTENISGQKPFLTLASDDDIPYILLDAIGLPEQIDAAKDLIKGKICLVSRGSTTFVEKCNLAAEAGAIAIMIYNNQPGTISMALDDYIYEAPAVSITMADADVFRARADDYGTVTVGEEEVQYYTGTLVVAKDAAVQEGDPEYYTMSDFSSMGTPSSLTLKPEITAPGGNIFSVNGAHDNVKVDNETEEEYLTGIVGDSTTYESMSGTSMAAPQVTGMAAVLEQYIRENGLAEKEGISVRTLSQSLLMSTSVPATDSYGEFYSVLKQGSGIANVGNAVNADAYIIMNPDATASYADGKVKAELGDDPDRDGVYSYSFTVNNMSDEEKTYTLESALFNQYPMDYYGMEIMLNDTEALQGFDAVYTVDGKTTDEVTVPAGGSAEVAVELTLSDDNKDYLDSKFVNGTYVEGYTFLTPGQTEDGALDDVEYSIPILAYYGNYSDASMYDVSDLNEWLYGDGLYPYSLASYMRGSNIYFANMLELAYYDSSTGLYTDVTDYTANPYSIEDPNALDRKAINSNTYLTAFVSRNIDTASIYTSAAFDADGKVLGIGDIKHDVSPAFYYPTYGTWLEIGEDGLYYYGGNYVEFGKTPADYGVKEGDYITLGSVAIPEYYTKGKDLKKGQIADMLENGTLGKGVFKGETLLVDDTMPEIVSADLTVKATSDTGRTFEFDAQDNQYIAYAAVLTMDPNTMEVAMVGGYVPEQSEAGEEIHCKIEADLGDIGDQDYEDYAVIVCDYAGNESYYSAEYVQDFSISENIYVIPGDTEQIEVYPEDFTAPLTWTSKDPSIATVDENGVVTGVKTGITKVVASTAEGPARSCKVLVLFEDVTNWDDWFFEPVYWALENGITTGATDTLFKPKSKCTRAQVVTFLYRMAGEPAVTIDNPFTDVTEEDYYYNAVLWAYENGITTGYASEPGLFKPKAVCTRCQVVTFMYRMMGEPEVTIENPFTDVKPSAYYYNAVLWAYENGITTGVASDPSKFMPKNNCVRRQVVTFLYRLAQIQ